METSYFSHCWGVFEGGGVRGAAHAGAYEAAKDLGIQFERLAGTSAGSIVASLIAAGGTPEDISEILINTDISKLLSPAKKMMLSSKITTQLLKWQNIYQEKPLNLIRIFFFILACTHQQNFRSGLKKN